MCTPKHLVYELAATIEEESNRQLIAIPCEHGAGLAVSDGLDIRHVESAMLSSPESIRSYVAQWLGEPPPKPS